MEINDIKLRKFFLEMLASKEVAEIELRIIREPDFAFELDRVETDLMEDYLENSLSSEESELFEKKYLICDERRKRLAFLKSLKSYSQKLNHSPDVSEKQSDFFEPIKSFFRRPKVAVTFAVVVILLGLGIAWRVLQPANSANTEIITMNRQDFSDLEKLGNFLKIDLARGTLRSDNNTEILDSQKLSEKILFRLALPTETPHNSNFQVNFLKDKTSLVTLNNIRHYANQNGQELRLLIPSAILKKGEYQIEVSRNDLKENKTFYSFKIQ